MTSGTRKLIHPGNGRLEKAMKVTVIIDLLITDQEEAFRLSGGSTPQKAINFFLGKKVSSLMITNGSKNIITWSDGQFFTASGIKEMPVSEKVINEKKAWTDR